MLAKDRGIEVRELKTESSLKYSNLVSVRVVGEHDKSVVAAGVVGADGVPILVRWNNVDLRASLAGHALVMFNADRPGVVGAIGTLLGHRGINISQVNLARSADGKDAVSLWNVDAAIPSDVLVEIAKAAHVAKAMAISL
jgi:D-3-phosphoglycerate dehydrogenase